MGIAVEFENGLSYNGYVHYMQKQNCTIYRFTGKENQPQDGFLTDFEKLEITSG